MIRVCTSCNKEFKPTQWNQIYCGSKTEKTGCSYGEHINRIGKYNLTTGKQKILDLTKKWMKKQRKENTPYAQRQRNLKRNYLKTEYGKAIAKLWRKKNLSKVLEWNRRRAMKNRHVEGSHTQKQWQDLKKEHAFKCMKCGISEQELSVKWIGTPFIKLTRDHIKPLSKGGTDYIQNIRPLCVSCNSIKRDSLVVVCTSMYANPVHIGHIRLIQDAAKLGDYLIVIINNDKQVELKGSKVFMNQDERCAIVKSLKGVDEVILSIDNDRTVCRTLTMLSPDIFAKGGDSTDENVPEKGICKIVFGVGGGKIQSSSWLKAKI